MSNFINKIKGKYILSRSRSASRNHPDVRDAQVSSSGPLAVSFPPRITDTTEYDYYGDMTEEESRMGPEKRQELLTMRWKVRYMQLAGIRYDQVEWHWDVTSKRMADELNHILRLKRIILEMQSNRKKLAKDELKILEEDKGYQEQLVEELNNYTLRKKQYGHENTKLYLIKSWDLIRLKIAQTEERLTNLSKDQIAHNLETTCAREGKIAYNLEHKQGWMYALETEEEAREWENVIYKLLVSMNKTDAQDFSRFLEHHTYYDCI